MKTNHQNQCVRALLNTACLTSWPWAMLETTEMLQQMFEHEAITGGKCDGNPGG
jgi:hypothetical protein